MTTVLRILRHTELVAAEPALAAYQVRCEARPGVAAGVARPDGGVRAAVRPVTTNCQRPSGGPYSGLNSEHHGRPPQMDIQGLGYVGVLAKTLEDWTSFGTRFLGIQ